MFTILLTRVLTNHELHDSADGSSPSVKGKLQLVIQMILIINKSDNSNNIMVIVRYYCTSVE